MTSAFGLKRGAVVGQYRIIRTIGKGGMGVVYEAFEEGLNRRVAIKMIHEEHAQDEEAIKRFEVEGRAIARVNHPNVVTVYNLGRYEGLPYLAMEYVEGPTLRHFLKKKVFPVKEALPLFRQVLVGVQALHEHGIVHRDLKPNNLIYQPNQQIKIVDFGVAKMLLGTNHEITGAGMIIGSAKYISPEGASGGAVTVQSDIWSLGVLFYEMLIGETPFEAEVYTEVLELVRNAPIDFPLVSKVLINKKIRSLIKKMLQRSPEKRFLNAEEVLHYVDAIIKDMNIQKPTVSKSKLAKYNQFNIYDEEAVFESIKKKGFDNYRTKMIMSLAINEQAKIDERRKLESDVTIVCEDGKITISEVAIKKAIRTLDGPGLKKKRNKNQERRKTPRIEVTSERPVERGRAIRVMEKLEPRDMPAEPKQKQSMAIAFVTCVVLLSGFLYSRNSTNDKDNLREPAAIEESREAQAQADKAAAEAEAAEALRVEAIQAEAVAELAKQREMEILKRQNELASQRERERQKAEYGRVKKAAAALKKKLATQKAAKKKAAEKKLAKKRKAAAAAKKAAAAKVRAAAKKAAAAKKREALVKLDVPKVFSPVDGTTFTSSGRSPASILFFWAKQPKAGSYEMEFAQTAKFKKILLKEKVNNNQYSLNRTLPYGKLYWRVRARKGQSKSNWSSPRSLVNSPPE